MVSVNGNYDNKGNYYFTKEIAKKEIAEGKVEKAVVEENVCKKQSARQRNRSGFERIICNGRNFSQTSDRRRIRKNRGFYKSVNCADCTF